MPSGLLGVVGIILGYAGIGLTLIGVAWTHTPKGRRSQIRISKLALVDNYNASLGYGLLLDLSS